MANTSSAEKANRAGARKRVFNVRRKNALKDAVKNTLAAVAKKQGKEAAALLPKAYQAIDKATKAGIMNKNAAARMKSHLSSKIKGVA